MIRARLADAKFFFDQDRNVSLEIWVPRLKEIVFHEKLGSQYDRIQRSRMLAREIAPLVGAEPMTPSGRPCWPRPIWSAAWSASSPSCRG